MQSNDLSKNTIRSKLLPQLRSMSGYMGDVCVLLEKAEREGIEVIVQEGWITLRLTGTKYTSPVWPIEEE